MRGWQGGVVCWLSVVSLWLGCAGGAGAKEPAESREPLRDPTAEVSLIRGDFELADGPAWDGWGSLFVPDVKAGKLYRYHPNADRWQVWLPDAGRISATYFQNGRLYVADNGNSRIAVLEGKTLRPLVQLDTQARPPQRPNDLVVDRQGGIYFTLTPRGEVHYVAPGESNSRVVAEVETPNGLILSPDESTLYVAAYVPKQIWAFSLTEPGKPDAGRLLARMDDGPERGADGMCVDRAGNIYCCGPADVWVWNGAGELLDKIPVPTRPINCGFGGNDMQTLYITAQGGFYSLPMRISGRFPHPPATPELQPDNPTRPSTAWPSHLEARLDVVYAQYGQRKLLADLFLPEEAQRAAQADSHSTQTGLPGIVVVHGGGWVKGDKTKFRALAIELANRGYVTMAIEYRLAGEAKFPAAMHDCQAAVRYLRTHAAEYGVDPDWIGAVGGSAGGHLVGLLATGYDHPELQGTGGWPEVSSRPSAAVVMAGPLDIATGPVAERSRLPRAVSFANVWFGASIDENPDLYHLADAREKISAGDPPMLFLVGELDNPERNAPARAALKELGIDTDVIVYPGAKHGCWNQLPWIHQFANDIDVFFRKH